jgi:polyhydroxybutyrate depolymerase
VRLESDLVSALLLIAATAFAQDSKKEGATSDRTISVGGQERSYRLHLPPGFAAGKPVPLVVCLHGAGGTGRIQEALTGFDALADRKGFAVAYPDGRRKMWVYMDAGALLGRERPAARAGGIGDAGFLWAMVEELIRDGTADARRIYFTGISNGAYMSNTMGCQYADRIAAIAPVAGTMPLRMGETAKPQRALPVLYIHGTADALVGADGSDFLTKRESSLSADGLVEWWAAKNGCAGKPTVEKLPDKEKDDTTVERLSWTASEKGAEVVYYKIAGGGHTWPGGSAQPERMLGAVCRDINATELIWEFFSKHALPEAPKK